MFDIVKLIALMGIYMCMKPIIHKALKKTPDVHMSGCEYVLSGLFGIFSYATFLSIKLLSLLPSIFKIFCYLQILLAGIVSMYGVWMLVFHHKKT